VTTDSGHIMPVAPNLMNQTFQPTAPGQVWVTDLTYVARGEGWLYLAGVKDVFTCEIVGYATSDRMKPELPGRALFRAVPQHRPSAGTIHHSIEEVSTVRRSIRQSSSSSAFAFQCPARVTATTMHRWRAFGEVSRLN
jgi:transposase InsO family protein